MARRIKVALLLFLLAGLASATPFTANLRTLLGILPAQSWLQLDLRGCGTYIVQGGATYIPKPVILRPNGAGNITNTVVDESTYVCGGAVGTAYYSITIFYIDDHGRTVTGSQANYDIAGSQTFNLNTATVKNAYIGAQGPQGPPGADGQTGAPGSAWYQGSGVPSSGLGVNNDFYLNTVPGDVYQKAAGAWALIANIKGSNGAAGAAGTTGANGSAWFSASGVPSIGTGVNNDFDLDVTTGFVYQKQSGVWVQVASIRGPAGPTGPSGGSTNWLGAWSASTTYHSATFDSVSSGGSSYVAILDGINHVPPNATYWQLLAQAGTNGTSGSNGTNGTNGVNGATWFSAAGVPSSGTGADGDFDLNTTTQDVYRKASGVWSIIANIKGATGATGTAGVAGAAGATWYQGAGVPSAGTGANGDFDLNTATGDVYNKASGTWSLVANIKGPAGTAAASGTTKDMQFNVGGSLTADTGNFTYDSATKCLKVGSTLFCGPGGTSANSWFATNTSAALPTAGSYTGQSGFQLGPDGLFYICENNAACHLPGGTSGGVTSVAGRTGIVTLTSADVGLSNVPNVDMTNIANFPTAWATGTWNSSVGQQSSFFDGIFSVVGSSGTDQSFITRFDTASGSQQSPLHVAITGINQLAVCWAPGPQAQVVFGITISGQTAAQTCSNVGQTQFAKNVMQSSTGTHNVLRTYQASTTATVAMHRYLTRTAAGTGWYFAEGFAGVVATSGDIDASGPGSLRVWSIRGDGLFTGSFSGPLTGTASLSTAFAATPTICSAGLAARGVDVNGNALNCFTPSGAVSSVFGRTGAVVATSGDYTVAQVTGAAPIASPTFTGTVTTQASAAGGAGFNLPHGAAPTAPTNGDLWTTTAGMFARINGGTVGPFGTGGGAVSSVFTRTGAVVAVSGDYTVAQVTGAAPLASPTFTGTVNGITATMVGLGSVTNDAQTKAAVMPNTVPTAGQIPVGNAGGTAYVPVAVSGDSTMTSAGVMTNTKINGTLLSGLASVILQNTTTTGVPIATTLSDNGTIVATSEPIASGSHTVSDAECGATVTGAFCGAIGTVQGTPNASGFILQAIGTQFWWSVAGSALAPMGITAATVATAPITGSFVSSTGTETIACPTCVATVANPAVITIGSGTSISATSLCSTTNCPAGEYLVHASIAITTGCTTTGSYIVWLGFTDDGGAKTGSSTTTFIPFPVNGSGVTTVGTLVPLATTNYANGTFFLHTTGAATSALGSINYGTTATACGSGGPMVGKLYLDVTRVR
jgi:hypothetical protein